MKAAIYLRVSDDSQDYENQRPGCMALADRLGHEVVADFAETASAWRAGHQKALAEAYKSAQRGRFRVLIVWALDRLNRGGVGAMLETYNRFSRVGCQIISVQESWTITSGEMTELLLAIAGWVAGFESKRRSERTKEGLARAQANGIKLGRPRKT